MPIEITDTAIHFHGVGGLLVLMLALVGIVRLFKMFLEACAGRHKDDWVIKLLFWIGAIGLVLRALGVRL